MVPVAGPPGALVWMHWGPRSVVCIYSVHPLSVHQELVIPVLRRACGHTYGKLKPWAVGSAALAAEVRACVYA